MEKSLAFCSFDDVKFFTSEETDYPHVKINKINNLAEYSLFAIKELWKHINTDYLLIVQHDGWILNPDAWDNAWYDLDYIGGNACWTDPDENGMGGNGGFSFRSKRLMQECDKILVDHNKQYFDPEDIAISGGWDHCYRKTLIEKGFKFATRKIQDKFSLDYGIWDGQFGHHKGDLRNFKEEKVTKIVKAVYGTDQRQLDLTEYIKGLSSCFYVGNHTFLADPHINTVKYLTVEFENGEVRKYREGEYANLGVEIPTSSLGFILNKNGSDKSTVHSYDVVYEKEFDKMRYEKLNILEIGCLNGSSLRSWEEYFPNSIVYGIDINNVEINSERIIFRKLDGTDEKEIEKIFSNTLFDIVIDDASHNICDQIKSHKIFSKKLNKNGLYFIEDIQNFEEASKNEYFKEWKKIDHRTVKGRYDDVIFFIG